MTIHIIQDFAPTSIKEYKERIRQRPEGTSQIIFNGCDFSQLPLEDLHYILTTNLFAKMLEKPHLWDTCEAILANLKVEQLVALNHAKYDYVSLLAVCQTGDLDAAQTMWRLLTPKQQADLPLFEIEENADDDYSVHFLETLVLTSKEETLNWMLEQFPESIVETLLEQNDYSLLTWVAPQASQLGKSFLPRLFQSLTPDFQDEEWIKRFGSSIGCACLADNIPFAEAILDYVPQTEHKKLFTFNSYILLKIVAKEGTLASVKWLLDRVTDEIEDNALGPALFRAINTATNNGRPEVLSALLNALSDQGREYVMNAFLTDSGAKFYSACYHAYTDFSRETMRPKHIACVTQLLRFEPLFEFALASEEPIYQHAVEGYETYLKHRQDLQRVAAFAFTAKSEDSTTQVLPLDVQKLIRDSLFSDHSPNEAETLRLERSLIGTVERAEETLASIQAERLSRQERAQLAAAEEIIEDLQANQEEAPSPERVYTCILLGKRMALSSTKLRLLGLLLIATGLILTTLWLSLTIFLATISGGLLTDVAVVLGSAVTGVLFYPCMPGGHMLFKPADFEDDEFHRGPQAGFDII